MALSAPRGVDISTLPMRRDFPAGSIMTSAERTVPKGANRSFSSWVENEGGSPSTNNLLPIAPSFLSGYRLEGTTRSWKTKPDIWRTGRHAGYASSTQEASEPSLLSLLNGFGQTRIQRGAHGMHSPDASTSRVITCSNRRCVCSSTTKVSRPYSWPRTHRTIAAATKMLSWFGKLTVKEHVCPNS